LKQKTKVSNTNTFRPFLKWAGGKSQLIPEIFPSLPQELKKGHFTYVEPFIGSGAILFRMLTEFPDMENVIINDFNTDLINTYITIRDSAGLLITSLEKLDLDYKSLKTEEEQREFFLHIRTTFNSRTGNLAEQSSYLIFLNKTCFNGLFRVNSKNLFNVPFGKYKNPLICDAENILRLAKALRNVIILNGDYSETLRYANQETFVYLDPPYKPISSTASFNSYAKNAFDDSEQIRLKNFCDELTKKGTKWLLSNSDLKNINPEDTFFDDLYSDYAIKRIKAKRAINSIGKNRGEINELLISNY